MRVSSRWMFAVAFVVAAALVGIGRAEDKGPDRR